jgi:hypothetical protein
MKKRFRAPQIFLVIAISFFVLTLPAYLRYIKLSEANVVSSGLSFENPDQQSERSDYENELEGFGPGAISITFLPGTSLLKQSFHSFSQELSPRQKPFILRC